MADQFLVDTAHSGEETLERIEPVMPDIILLDVVIGGMDGYAVCSALRAQIAVAFPLDTLKIDRSFVTALGTGATGKSVVHAIVALVQGLKLKVSAEGIKTQARADRLRRNDRK
ncbi:EAL domain-containing protein [Thiorhodovibrio litoralis]|uniref:EAL domain-containing protein n=1 Tax=Thiorhodovibrio litoralis TaxID=2952932 RepID=UPI001F5DED83|nr:EAL domain-containing protein [Thiorhodovibrio litoralis]